MSQSARSRRGVFTVNPERSLVVDDAVMSTQITFTEWPVCPPGVMFRMQTASSCCSLLANCPRFAEAPPRKQPVRTGFWYPPWLVGEEAPVRGRGESLGPGMQAGGWKNLHLCDQESEAGGRV